jgi:hypothetical protein
MYPLQRAWRSMKPCDSEDGKGFWVLATGFLRKILEYLIADSFMKIHVSRFLLLIPILLCSCSGDDLASKSEEVNPIYISFRLKGSSYHVSNMTYDFRFDGSSMICASEWVKGRTDFSGGPKRERLHKFRGVFVDKKSFQRSARSFRR